MAKVTYLTADGEKKLRAELEHLSTTVRHELSKRLRAAIQMGDLSENADYAAAKEEQGFIEGRIEELTDLLRSVEIIEENNKPRDCVDIGSKVTIREENDPEETYLLVGPQEADPKKGRISYSSPIGEALMGHRAGDLVSVNSPGGKFSLKIVSIQ
jgi:transcription elongation factor GreA